MLYLEKKKILFHCLALLFDNVLCKDGLVLVLHLSNHSLN